MAVANNGFLQLDDENGDILILTVVNVVYQMLFLDDNNGDCEYAPWVNIFLYVDGFRRLGDPTFAMHFRMRKPLFEELVNAVGNHLLNTNRSHRNRTPLDVCLLMGLWILMNRDTFRSTALKFNTSPSVVFFHYAYIIQCLREMAPMFIKWPTAAERAATSRNFYQKSGFPGVIGCIDGMATYITAPLEEDPAYFNRHHCHSVTTQAVFNEDLLVIDLYVGEPGSLHDSRVFRRSPLSASLLERRDMLAPDEHILAGSAYTLTDKVLRPYEDNRALPTPTQTNFNRLLSACRSTVERGFGAVKEKFQRLKYFPSLRIEYCVDHITSCFVLHNFITRSGEQCNVADDARDAGPFPCPPVGPQPDGAARGQARAQFEPDHPLLADAKEAGVRKRDNLAAQLMFP